MALHGGLYLLVLVVMAGFTNLDSPWMSDDGAYASQVRLVESGTWAYDGAPSWGTPPESNATLGSSSVVDGVEYPYVKHPAWIHVLRFASWLDLPILGMCAVNVFSALAAAVLAGHLAGSKGRTRVIAFWAVALGPPLVWSLGLWAHATACALGAAAIWCVVAWRERGGWWRMAGAAGAMAALVLIRTEGLLIVPAIGAVLVLHLWDRRQDRRAATAAPVAVAGLALVATAVIARLVDLRLVHAVAPGASTTVPSSGTAWLPGRLSGFEATFVSGGFNQRDFTIGLLTLLLIAAGGVLWSRRPSDGLGPAMVVVGVLFFTFRAIAGWDSLIQGLFAAAPVLTFGLAGVRWSRGTTLERSLVVFSGTYALAVVVTQYSVGGATEWGGRFLAPVVVPLAVLAAVAIDRLVDAGRGSIFTSRQAVSAITVLLVALPVLPALGSTNSNRARHAAITADLIDADVDAAIATYPTLPLLLWPTIGEVPWTVTGPEDSEQLSALIEKARHAGEERLAIVGYTVDPTAVEGLGYHVEQRSRHVLVLGPVQQ